MISYFILGITYGFVAGVQPGPLQTYLISQTIKKGWKSTLPAVFAPIISDIPIFILAVLILNSLPHEFIVFLRIVGGLFLIYLAGIAFLNWKAFEIKESDEKDIKNKTLFNAVIVNLLNPHPYLGWGLIMGPIFIEGWKEDPSNGISLIFSFYATLVFFLILTILIFALARKLGPKMNKHLLGLSAIALLLFGVYQIIIGFFY